ncbi:MAG: DUF2156 domain-containing protein [Clostridia bacterium]|nr:DUF2156 domain-containing protein [Clostridia bacterium]
MLTARRLKFKEVTTADLDLIAPYFAKKKAMIADHSILYLHMWGALLGTEYAIDDDVLLLRRNGKRGISYYPPLGRGEVGLKTHISRLASLGEAEIVLSAVPAHAVAEIESEYQVLEKETSRRWADYIYNAHDLATLQGHRYNKKRNLVHQFERLYPAHTYEDITSENLAEVMGFMRSFMQQDTENEDKNYENERVLDILTEYGRLPVIGGLLRVDGQVAAFTVAEHIDNTLLVHVEKADRRFKGVYQYINYRFVREQMQKREFQFVNREDDAGDEGLRQAKLSYCPVDILHKYRMVLKF